MKREHKFAEQQWRASNVVLQYNVAVLPRAKVRRPWWKFW